MSKEIPVWAQTPGSEAVAWQLAKIQAQAVLIPSGQFVFQGSPYEVEASSRPLSYVSSDSPLSGVQTSIFNPMPRRAVSAKVLDQSAAKMSEVFRRTYETARIIGEAERKSYADAIVAIGRKIAIAQFDVIVVPVRGGMRPAAQLKVLDQGKTPHFWLPFSAGSQPKHRAQILEFLTEGIAQYTDRPHLKIGVIDTAISGHGAFALAELLRALHHSNVARRWAVTFHLLYDRTNKNHAYPSRTSGILKLGTQTLKFSIELYCVDSLIVEDWNPAFGISIDWGADSRSIVKPSITSGRLIVQSSDGTAQLIESTEMDSYFDLLISTSISERILSDPDYTFTGDVWQDYVDH